MPSLTILAGPNGAGKTRNTDQLLSLHLLPTLPVDLDLLVAQAIDDLPHSFYGADTRLSKSVDKLFYSYCIESIKTRADFCYECNFRKEQLKYVGLFEEAGYEINVIYFILNSIEQSIERVNFRVIKEGGRSVDNNSIQVNFTQGLNNLDNHFQDFNRVILVDSSQDNYINPSHSLNIQLDIEGNKVTCYNKEFPSKELKPFIPIISGLVNQTMETQRKADLLKSNSISNKKNKGLSM
jgi:predicted ABC-type ATPase